VRGRAQGTPIRGFWYIETRQDMAAIAVQSDFLVALCP
jgi:hypothetical protein